MTLLLWPVMIYLAYRFVLLNIKQIEERESGEKNNS